MANPLHLGTAVSHQTGLDAGEFAVAAPSTGTFVTQDQINRAFVSQTGIGTLEVNAVNVHTATAQGTKLIYKTKREIFGPRSLTERQPVTSRGRLGATGKFGYGPIEFVDFTTVEKGGNSPQLPGTSVFESTQNPRHDIGLRFPDWGIGHQGDFTTGFGMFNFQRTKFNARVTQLVDWSKAGEQKVVGLAGGMVQTLTINDRITNWAKNFTEQITGGVNQYGRFGAGWNVFGEGQQEKLGARIPMVQDIGHTVNDWIHRNLGI